MMLFDSLFNIVKPYLTSICLGFSQNNGKMVKMAKSEPYAHIWTLDIYKIIHNSVISVKFLIWRHPFVKDGLSFNKNAF